MDSPRQKTHPYPPGSRGVAHFFAQRDEVAQNLALKNPRPLFGARQCTYDSKSSLIEAHRTTWVRAMQECLRIECEFGIDTMSSERQSDRSLAEGANKSGRASTTHQDKAAKRLRRHILSRGKHDSA